MGWIIVLIRNALVWMDKQSERSIVQVVPHLEYLLLEPKKILSGREITIKPARRVASGMFLGLFLGMGVWVALVFIVFTVTGPLQNAAQKQERETLGLLLLLAFLILIFLSMLIMLRVVHGGHMVLNEQGVELRYRGTDVFCPWAVFNTPGQPYSPGYGRVVLPVARAAAGLVVARRHESILAEGNHVDTPQLRFRSANEALLRALYVVNAAELGKVILHLGRILGQAEPGRKPPADYSAVEIAEPEPVVVEHGGWITVRITRLQFPSACCDCGTTTTARQKVRCFEPFFGLGRLLNPMGRESVHLWIPVCHACQTENHRRERRAAWYAQSLVLVAIVLTFVLVVLMPANPFFGLLFVATVLLAPGLGLTVGYRIGQARGMPVQLRNYAPEKGTIALRFRNAHFGERLVETMRATAGV
jgi:hypothetical protein